MEKIAAQPPASPTGAMAAFGLENLAGDAGFNRDAGSSVLRDTTGMRTVIAPREFVHSLRLVLEKESPGAWRTVLKSSGLAGGQQLARHLDAEFARQGQPGLSALPLESCLVLIQNYFARQGWGRLEFDLADAAEHGLVVARLEHSGFAATLTDVADFADALPAGVLQGFFEHLSGEGLGCEEIACVRRGAPRCVFVITAPERLAAVRSFFGAEPVEAILVRLKA